MAYQRIDYTNKQGDKSAAYFDSVTHDAWDVFTRRPVALTQDPLTGSYNETIVTARLPENTPVRHARKRPLPVSLGRSISPWTIIPAGLFGLGMIWLELTFGRH